MTSERILLLEDKPIDALVTRSAIESAGYAVTSTGNETDFVAALREGRFCAIVADHSLPGSSSERAIELAKMWQPGVPVVCISGVVNEQDGAVILAHGAVDYIGKDQLWRLPFALKRATERTKQLAASVDELQNFAYCVAHDLKSPLFGLHQIAQLLLSQEQLDMNECRTILETISDDAMRMSEMTQALLKLYTMSLRELTCQQYNLSTTSHNILETLAQQSPSRKVAVTVEPDLLAMGDPSLFDAVLENLIGNAWKFTARAEEAKIEIGKLDPEAAGAEADSSAKDDTTIFFVRDNGAGFDMRYSGKLFKPFQRLHSPSDFVGMGIGLATVNRIIKRYNGKVWAESQKGMGSTFFFTLPNK